MDLNVIVVVGVVCDVVVEAAVVEPAIVVVDSVVPPTDVSEK